MSSLCKTCKYADIAKKERTVIKNGMMFKQSAGAVICTRPKIREISITDGEMKCSDYMEVKAYGNQ